VHPEANKDEDEEEVHTVTTMMMRNAKTTLGLLRGGSGRV
jgi:hypothetical protein